MNNMQKAGKWLLEKATGIRAWRSQDQWPVNPYDILGLSGDSSSGVSLTGPTALQLSAVYGCCNILGKIVSSFPIDIIKKTSGGRTVVEGHPLADLLDASPNPDMTSMEFFEALLLSFNLYGNSYAEIVKIGKRVTALWPLMPDRMNVIREPDGTLSYKYTKMNGNVEPYSQTDILHIKNFSIDGITGLSPIAIAREVFGKAVAQQRYGAAFYRNGGRPSGYIKAPGARPDATKEQQQRDSWNSVYGKGADAGNQTAVLWNGMEYVPISLPPADALYIDSSKMSDAQIAAIYGVPLNLLAQSDKSATYASAEQFDLQFAKYTIQPLCVRFEKAIKKALLGSEIGVSPKFNIDALLRSDSQSRAQYLSTLVQNGIMDRNEARGKIDLNRRDGADELTVQSNMLDLAALQKLAAQPINPPATGGNTDVPAN